MPDFDITGIDDIPWKQYIFDIKEIEISEGVTSIGNYAFYKYSDLTDIVIPNSITKVGKNCFKNNNVEPIRIYCTQNSPIEKYFLENGTDDFKLVYTYIVTDFGANGNDEEDDTNAIQVALDKAKYELINKTDEKVNIYFPAGKYYISKRLEIFSNTKLILDDNSIIENSNTGTQESLLIARHIDDSGNICTGKDCKHGGYTQWKNITLDGGTWNFNNDGSINANGLIFAHGENLVVRNTTLINSAGHTLNPSCSRNVLIENVTIKDQVSSQPKKSDTTNEVLHLDSASTGEPGSYPLDGTPIKNVIIQNCTFDNILCGIGSHSNYQDESYFGDEIVIRDNVFNNIKCYAINLFAHKNVEVYNNRAIGGIYEKNIIDTEKRAYGFVQTYFTNANIHDNEVSNFEYVIVNSNKSSKYEFVTDDEDIVNKFYILTFESNGGTGVMEPQVLEYGDNLKIAKNKFTKVGYRFEGWIAFNNYPESQKYKCYGDWYTQAQIDSNNYQKYTYKDESFVKTLSWWHHSEVIMTAQWLEVVTAKDNLNYIEKIIELDGKKYLVAKKGANVGDLLSDLTLNIDENNDSTLKIKDKVSSEYSDNENLLKTDEKIVISGSEEDIGKIIVVKGDLNSDGKVDLKDIAKLNNYRINKEKAEAQWSVAQKIAFKYLKNVDITDTELENISFRDIVSLNNYRIKIN